MKTSLATLLLMLLATPACVNAVEGFSNPKYGGIKQASFDLGCPVDQMQVVDLGGGGSWTVGVNGCGKKAVYKQIGGTWVNNTGSDDGAKK